MKESKFSEFVALDCPYNTNDHTSENEYNDKEHHPQIFFIPTDSPDDKILKSLHITKPIKPITPNITDEHIKYVKKVKTIDKDINNIINENALKEISNKLRKNFENITSIDELDVIFNTKKSQNVNENRINKIGKVIGIKKISHIDMNVYDTILHNLQNYTHLEEEKLKLKKIPKDQEFINNNNISSSEAVQPPQKIQENKNQSNKSFYQQNSLNLNYKNDNQTHSGNFKNQSRKNQKELRKKLKFGEKESNFIYL